MRRVTKVMCELEIDHDRGVVYAHLVEAEEIKALGAQTILRVQGLGPPILDLNEIKMIDVRAAKS